MVVGRNNRVVVWRVSTSGEMISQLSCISGSSSHVMKTTAIGKHKQQSSTGPRQPVDHDRPKVP